MRSTLSLLKLLLQVDLLGYKLQHQITQHFLSQGTAQEAPAAVGDALAELYEELRPACGISEGQVSPKP